MPLFFFFFSWRSLFEVFKSAEGSISEASVEYLRSFLLSESLLCAKPAACSGSLFSKSERPALSKSCSIAAFECSRNGSTLNLRVPVKSVGSYAMTVIFSLTWLMSISEMLMPSISMRPPHSSTMRERASDIVDLPAPVRPTTPTLMPGLTSNDKSSSTMSVLGL